MSEYVVRALSPDTWDGFAGLAQRHNGVFGGCWCTYFHTMHSEKTFDADDNRSLKRRLVEEGRAHAALVYDGDEAVAWCEYGSPPRSCRTSTTASSTRRSLTSSPTTGLPASSVSASPAKGAVGRRAEGCPRPDLGGGRWRRRGLPARHAGQEEVRALQRGRAPSSSGRASRSSAARARGTALGAPHRALTHRGGAGAGSKGRERRDSNPRPPA